MPALTAQTQLDWDIQGIPELVTTTPCDHVTTVNQMMADDYEIVAADMQSFTMKKETITIKVTILEVAVVLGLLNPEVLK